MEDFDVFTNEICMTRPLYVNILNKFVKDTPETPIGPNYQITRKLQAEESLADNDDLACAFHLSESVSTSVRTMAVYRDEQMKSNAEKLHKVTSFIKPIKDVISSSNGKKREDAIPFPSEFMEEVNGTPEKDNIKDKEPFNKKYLNFSEENNAENFQKILKELPKEWTVVQLTAPYNPNENVKQVDEYKSEVNSIYLSVFTNDYLGQHEPFTVQIPANEVKEGERPLFKELYSLFADNYETIKNAQVLNKKRLVRNYWARRDDIDLRMKSVINIMNREWLGGWCCLMTGKLVDSSFRKKVIQFVDSTIADWGFVRLTQKQKIMLYNLIECCGSLSSGQIKTCIRRILTEYGNPDDVRQVIDITECSNCTTEFNFLSELCLKCLAQSFQKIHRFGLVDGVKAFSEAAKQMRESDEWATLKQAKRHPVILIVDEILDTFPWECLPLLNIHPISRIENIHFLYNMYKVHENNIVDGHLQAKAEKGRYLINPEQNLPRMEKRMKSFVEYWRPDWEGEVSKPPEPETFLNYLQEADLFLYCGHGDGIQFSQGATNSAGVEGCFARASAILSGCGSGRLMHAPGRGPAQSAHIHYHIAYSPLVIGMLWEVTDLEIDKVVTSLVAYSVPSSAPLHWEGVGKTKWGQGILETNVKFKIEDQSERDILSAVSKARRSTIFLMIASSVVARGLPIRIMEPNN